MSIGNKSQTEENASEFISRRSLVANSTALLAGAAAVVGVSSVTLGAKNALANNTSGVSSELAACINAGEICQAHCADELAKGNKDMGKCNRMVIQMLAVCKAMQTLAAMKSDRAKALAAVCIAACQDCADACAEHKAHWSHKMHMECKDCHDACLALIKAAKKVYG